MTTPKQSGKPIAPKKVVDWDAIEPHYRAGILSLKDLGAEFDVSDAAIVKHAKKREWTRNLTAKIQAKADAKVSAAAVSAEVSEKRARTEKAVVDANVDLQVHIRLGHRKRLQRLANVMDTMLDEVDAQTTHIDMLTEIVEAARQPDDNGRDRRNDLLQRVISLPERVDALMAATGIYRDQRGKKVVNTDGWEALSKGIGFQPTSVARVQEATFNQQNMIAQVKMVTTEISDKWATGIAQKDGDLIDETRRGLAQWNERNPQTPINIRLPAVLQKARKLMMSKEERITASAPKSMRAEVARALNASN